MRDNMERQTEEVYLDDYSKAYLDGDVVPPAPSSHLNGECASLALNSDVLDYKIIPKNIEVINDHYFVEYPPRNVTPTNFADIRQEENFHGKHTSEVAKPNLQSLNLRGEDLTDVNLKWVDLEGANLEEANLQMTNLEGKCLKMTNLQNAVLRWARLEIDIGTRLRGADLRGSHVKSYVLLTSSTLYGANLRGMHLEADLGTAALRGADLRGVQLIGAIPGKFALQNADLKGAYLKIEVIGSFVLQGADLRGAYITGKNLGHFTLHGADLRGAHIDADFAASLQNVDLTEAHL